MDFDLDFDLYNLAQDTDIEHLDIQRSDIKERRYLGVSGLVLEPTSNVRAVLRGLRQVSYLTLLLTEYREHPN